MPTLDVNMECRRTAFCTQLVIKLLRSADIAIPQACYFCSSAWCKIGRAWTEIHNRNSDALGLDIQPS